MVDIRHEGIMANQVEALRTMTVKELAKATGIQVWRIHELVAAGKGPPHFRLGRVIRFRANDVDAWLAAQVNRGMTNGR